MKLFWVILLVGIFATTASAQEEPMVVSLEVACSDTEMEIKIPRRGVKGASLGQWNIFEECHPKVEEKQLVLKLKLLPQPSCGVSSMKLKNEKPTYYHHIFVTTIDNHQHEMKVSCPGNNAGKGNNRLVKRNVLPAGFKEPDFIEITSVVSEAAPIPSLSVAVKQNGIRIGDSVTVSPGAPLTMEVSLDRNSVDVYGILVSYLVVTDNSEKNETIIYNGCTQDQYVFENFQTADGDLLAAKFRAFKFPGSSYLLFKGTVDVCLDKCQAIRCSNGEQGFGRRRRDTYNKENPNKIFEASMMTLIRVEDETNEAEEVFNMIKKLSESHDDWPIERRHPESHVDREISFTIFETNQANGPLIATLMTSFLIVLSSGFLRFL